jgi:starch phosphorylase
VGAENIFIFGLSAAEVEQTRRTGYDASAVIAASPRLEGALKALASGAFSPDQRDRYEPLDFALRQYDSFLVTADFDAYWDTQRKIDAHWRAPKSWWRTSILNTARVGWFSSDRAIREYADEIWQVPVGSPRRARPQG